VINTDSSSAAPLDPASVTPTAQPAHGSAACSAGNCTYTPTSGYTGADSFTYRVCDTSTPTPQCAVTSVSVQVGPNAVNDSASISQGSTLSSSVAGNDTYPPGSSFSVTGAPAHGSVTMNPNGSYSYTPTGTYSGADSFTYQVCEPAPNAALCSSATVSISVNPPNLFDPPFITKAAGKVDTQTLVWTITVDNNQNASAQNTQVRDPLPAGMTFVSGEVTCQSFGTSTVSDCYYDAANNRIVADALLKSDLGVANPATGPNRMTIVFEAQYTTSPVPITNVASACWDAQNSATNITACTQSVSGTAQYTPQPAAGAVPVPLNARWMLWLIAAAMLGFGGAAAARQRRQVK
jgi:uncharacterized repeat protein (TIGR01451 family)